VDTRIEEHEQAEHPTVPDERVPAEQSPERRDGERRREQTQRPAARLLLELFVGGGAEVRVQRSPEEPGERQQADEEDERLGDAIDRGRAPPRRRFVARRVGRGCGCDAVRSGQ
jgi:hypothetical protein